ncbi:MULTISPECIES: hypothetical protein [Rhodopirellula]|jgi:outer membrane murein-binding lipoprotein Lpp|uniref:Signal peptide protein n=2 Tax=Rhodopirellula europaea TaxID=1263866 RepID=M5SC47_9BACT|nr:MULTISPECIES: hypothetical protein [Rhodopirellula]EMB18750.1 signal peptide protein [Rhodopirellula europaea 6C]EMI23704.1 signal peptide protein [Rhodopirellula europaea SH398]MAP08023.1 hypothetical protein [Rhodopirellula sp.]MCR9206668.1 hypothetical protein [bacterium]|tara:strand:+ start:3130 stop:3309 length:180 start_codon:yes stop_codon:yes gene_type:complete
MRQPRDVIHFLLLTAALVAGFVVSGCDSKETVLDVETPDGGVEVNRDIDDGSLSVDVEE